MSTKILTDGQILNILLLSKREYEDICDIPNCGMCFCISKYISKFIGEPIGYHEIEDYIDKFNRDFLVKPEAGGHIYSSYWWPITDVDDRIKAFNKLIEHYYNKLIEHYKRDKDDTK